jgi:hypothetical protein
VTLRLLAVPVHSLEIESFSRVKSFADRSLRRKVTHISGHQVEIDLVAYIEMQRSRAGAVICRIPLTAIWSL